MGARLIRARLEAELVKAIDRACAEPMRWGHDDCALWCADVLRAALRCDPGARFRGRYDDQAGAHRVLGKGGLGNALRTAGRAHAWRRIDPALAQVGDIGVVELYGVRSCVLCRAPGRFVGRNENGVTVVPAAAVQICFKVAPHVRRARPELGRRIAMPAVHLRPRLVDTSAVAHEPISLSIGLAEFFTLAASATTIINTVVGVGLSIGLSYAASALLQRGNQPITADQGGAPNDPSIRYNTRQPIPPKRIIYGTAQVGGALFFEEKRNPFLYQGLLICAKPITRFRKLWIGSNELSFASLAPGGLLTPQSVVGQPNYASRLTTSLRLGATNQAIDPLLAREFPGLSGKLVSSADGTPIGNMTTNGGLAAAFDGNIAQGFAACATLNGTGSLSGQIGKDWGSGVTRIVNGFRITGPSNSGINISDGTDRTITLKLQGSTDNFSSSIVDLVSVPATLYANSPSNNTGCFAGGSDPNVASAFRYHRVLITETNGAAGSHNLYVAECEFFEKNGSDQFLQLGAATAVMRYHFGADQTEYTNLWGQQQRPNPIFLVDGIAVPDPRKSGNIVEYDPTDPVAVAAAEATWSWSNNAALCQAHYLTQPFGGRIDPRKVDWDKVARAADYDDGLISTNEGNLIRRGTIDGLITLNQSPADVISSMLSANRGFVLESAGKVWVSSSEPRTPVATIHDRIISGGIEYRAAKPKRDLINRLKVRFVAEDREYQTVDGPVLDRLDLQAADEELLEGVLDLPFTLDNRRAQLRQKQFIETARLGRRLTCIVDVELLACAADELVGNSITFSSDLFPQFNGEYLVENWGFTDQFGQISLSLSEYDAGIESDWNPAADQQPFTLAPLDTDN